jgi:hypothetical protein
MLIIQKAALSIDGDGLHYGALKLAQVRGGMLKARPQAFRRLVQPEQAAAIDKAIAAWNRGNKTSALLRLVHLGAPALGPASPSPGWLRHCELVKLAKAGFDPSQPRDDQGMWTSEGGGFTKPPVTVTPLGNAGASDADAGTIDDGVYHTTIGDDGKPVLPSAIPAQAEVPGEEEPTGEDGEEEEREEGIFGLTSAGERFVSAYNTLKQLDPDNAALQQKYLPADISSGAAADDLETAAGDAAKERALEFLLPGGQPIGQQGGGPDVREMVSASPDAETQAAFKYLTVGATEITPPAYNGKLMKLPGNAGIIGYRPVSSDNGPPTIDANIPGYLLFRIHYIEK